MKVTPEQLVLFDPEPYRDLPWVVHVADAYVEEEL